MPVRINLHPTHRGHAGGAAAVDVHGSTVGECLADLVRRHPGLGDALFAADGTLRRNIEIFLNGASTYPDEVSRPTRDGDEIHVTVMLAGG